MELSKKTKVVGTYSTFLLHLLRRRITGSTKQNKRSSRSHAILTLELVQVLDDENTAESEKLRGGPEKVRMRRSKLTIVDLAGSERVGKSKSDGLRLEEAKKINKSISALGNCVAALALASSKASREKTSVLSAAAVAKHVPLRDSQLTRLLSDSLGGNTRTVLVSIGWKQQKRG